mmetsp:Transcript_19252/g.28418  ORF Transcript_19252/g.28418 Transcript_19252/m.28418 type:complete len:232 (-) Transcript_19252:110-805(-)
MNQNVDPLHWFHEIPFVSKTYLSLVCATTALTALDVITPFQLYINWTMIIEDFEIWRIFTNFLFFGNLGLNFLFHLYFLVRYCRLLEEGEFNRKKSDFIFFIFFGGTLMVSLQPLVELEFLGSSLTFMMVYVWARRNEHIQMSLFGLFNFNAPYLPWVFMGYSLMASTKETLASDLLGIGVGHIYYFLAYIYPQVALMRRWRLRKILTTPKFLKLLCGEIQYRDHVHVHQQ